MTILNLALGDASVGEINLAYEPLATALFPKGWKVLRISNCCVNKFLPSVLIYIFNPVTCYLHGTYYRTRSFMMVTLWLTFRDLKTLGIFMALQHASTVSPEESNR